MSEDYCRLLQELQEAKKQISTLKNKNNTLSADNSILESNATSYKRNIITLKDQVATLEAQNTVLLKSQQSIMANYEDDILNIKAEIAKRQQQLSNGLRNGNQELSNLPLLRKQIQCELEQRYMQELQKKQQKINGLQMRVDQLSREKEIQKQKNILSSRETSQRMQQLENKHLAELKNYADRIYQQSHKRTFNSDENMLKKMRRQIDELRRTLNDKDSQIQTLMEEKNLLMKQKNNMEFRLAKQTEKLHENIQTYKVEIDTFKQIQSSNNLEKDNYRVKDQLRQIKKLKQKVEDLHEQIRKRQTKISDLEVANHEMQVQIKHSKSRAVQQSMQKYQQLQRQKQSLQRDIQEISEDCKYYKNKYQSVKNQSTNINHNSTSQNEERRVAHRENRQFSSNQIDHRNQIQSTNTVNRKNVINQINVTEEKNIKNISRISHDTESRFQDGRENGQRGGRSHGRDRQCANHTEYIKDREYMRDKSVNERVQKQRQKVRDIGRKYLQLQKKYQNVKSKLKQANEKILDLIRSKIDMKSPPKTTPNVLPNSDSKQDPQINSNHKWKSRANRWTSPQANITAHSDHHFMRSTTPKERQFYEKSLSFKNKSKLKDLKCINHEHSQIKQ